MDAREELNRLTCVFGKAFGTAARSHVLIVTGSDRHIVLSDSDRRVETAMHPTRDEAVAELRSILRADADTVVADVLDELASLASEGPITAEMLRTMARARRAR